MQAILSIGEEEARLAIDACLEAFRQRGKTGVIAVSDACGELLALWRIDEAPLPAIVIAQNKAYTAARTRTPSGDVGRAAQAEGADVHYHGDGRYVGWDGGAPVFHRKTCIGAIGVSGLSGAEDFEIALIGVDAINSILD